MSTSGKLQSLCIVGGLVFSLPVRSNDGRPKTVLRNWHCALSNRHFKERRAVGGRKASCRWLEKLLSGQEYALLLQNTWVWLFALTSGGSQPPASSVPTPLASAGACTRAHICTHRHVIKDNCCFDNYLQLQQEKKGHEKPFFSAVVKLKDSPGVSRCVAQTLVKLRKGRVSFTGPNAEASSVESHETVGKQLCFWVAQ